ncbi:hypothetical protein CEXT_400241 [Caerostris extrusa]|uniref:Uncharacterized protein n=1 Tax=Caerostris extrusa TaxID=172846 RepID=A0AAV4Q926_CAEEX|nr:hypothetical protein CEXT_400241 [Caerostris extrusa]
MDVLTPKDYFQSHIIYTFYVPVHKQAEPINPITMRALLERINIPALPHQDDHITAHPTGDFLLQIRSGLESTLNCRQTSDKPIHYQTTLTQLL